MRFLHNPPLNLYLFDAFSSEYSVCCERSKQTRYIQNCCGNNWVGRNRNLLESRYMFVYLEDRVLLSHHYLFVVRAHRQRNTHICFIGATENKIIIFIIIISELLLAIGRASSHIVFASHNPQLTTSLVIIIKLSACAHMHMEYSACKQ